MKKCIYRIVNGTLTLEADKQEDCGVIWNGEPKAVSNILTGANAIPIEWNFMQLKDGIDFAEFLIDVLMTAPFLVKWKFRGAMPLNFHVGVGICLISIPL